MQMQSLHSFQVDHLFNEKESRQPPNQSIITTATINLQFIQKEKNDEKFLQKKENEKNQMLF